MAHSEVPPEKIEAFLKTDYRFGEGGDSVTLRVNQRAGELLRWYARTGTSCGVFVTAFNPSSTLDKPEANEAAHRRLGEDLGTTAARVVEGAGADPSGQWLPEKSYMAFGIELDAAKALGKKYRQDVIVWVGSDAVPQLILLR